LRQLQRFFETDIVVFMNQNKLKYDILPHDTPIEVLARQYRIFAGLTLAQKARMTFELSDNMRVITAAGIRKMHPEYSDAQIMHELIVRLYGIDTQR
jgi:hypothetical protein